MNIHCLAHLGAFLLAVFVLCVCAVPLDTELMSPDLPEDNEVDRLFNEELELEENQPEAVNRRDGDFLRETRPAKWNKNFVGFSSLDKSAYGYSKFMPPCSMGEVCKIAGKRQFRCKCNNFSYCAAYSPSSNAKCSYSAVGIVYKQ